MKDQKLKKTSKLIKNDGFDQNGGHHELRHEKIMHFESGDVDFRATATRFVNIFVFLKFRVSQVLRAPSIRRRKYDRRFRHVLTQKKHIPST